MDPLQLRQGETSSPLLSSPLSSSPNLSSSSPIFSFPPPLLLLSSMGSAASSDLLIWSYGRLHLQIFSVEESEEGRGVAHRSPPPRGLSQEQPAALCSWTQTDGSGDWGPISGNSAPQERLRFGSAADVKDVRRSVRSETLGLRNMAQGGKESS